MSERYVVTSRRGEDAVRSNDIQEAERHAVLLSGEIRDTHEVVTA